MNGCELGVSLVNLALDPARGIGSYVCFISSYNPARPPTNEQCDLICRAIYDVRWEEGPPVGAPPSLRWFIRARVSQKNCPRCDCRNERGDDDDSPTMECAHCGHEFKL